ncbi:signal-regulatory protein beta-2-like isoform X2 [Anabas testudineus]|uniref:signal-regulatory protein beta-2-like isoform X2 n=1 Tax=Anabas testudineus TaxID=64144 RepID=UPI000E45E389|nr:signal-regulatory protein beta-2-like isoform X2 [Anabas testudineus]
MLTYFINVLLLRSLCLAQFSEIHQPDSFQTVKLGDSATIKCYIKSEMRKRVWYKVTTGKRLQLVAEFNSHYNRSELAKEFRQHYSLKFDRINSHLSITATAWEDVGTYFCGVVNLNNIEFGSGTLLILKGTKMITNSVVQLPKYESVHPGDSVTLRCSVHIDHCSAEHTSVVWLKNSDHSAPEIIYFSGNNNSTCQRTENETSTCVYTLLMRNLSSDDAGTYYCAVTSCGQILFGNGTRIIDYTETAIIRSSPTVIVLILSNVILGLMTLSLLWIFCKNQKKEFTEAGGSCED